MARSPFWRNPFVAESSEKQVRRRRAFRTAIETEYYESRRDAMKTLYRGGATLEEIGAVYGVTRERVRQVIAGEAKRGAGIDPVRAITVSRRAKSLTAAAKELGADRSPLKEALVSLGYWEALTRLWKWRHRKEAMIGDAELIEAIQRLAQRLGHTPSMNEMNAAPDTPTHTTYVRRWGNWAPACAAAGLRPARLGARGHKNRDPETGFKSHCKRGHPLSGENLYTYQADGQLRRICRACHRLREEKKRQKLIDAGLLKPRRRHRDRVAPASHPAEMAAS